MKDNVTHESRVRLYIRRIIATITLLKLLAVVVLLANSPSESGSKDHDISPIFENCVDTYKNVGISGLTILSKNLYLKYDANPSFKALTEAAVVDIFSFKVDEHFARLVVGAPHSEYFSELEFRARVLGRMKARGYSEDMQTDIIKHWQKVVFREMQKQEKDGRRD